MMHSVTVLSIRPLTITMKDHISNNLRHSGQRILILIVLMQTVMLRVVFHCNAECHDAKRHADIRLAESQFFY